jgi:SAM-dependent methyltransferase
MAEAAGGDSWAIGEAYERYVGRWSRLVADDFLAWIAVPPEKAWLDVGCGTGVLSERVLAHCAPSRVVGIDPSAGFLPLAVASVADPRVEFRPGDARALPVGDGEFDAVVSGLVLNFVPDHRQALAEFRRAARPGGTVALYVWDYAGEMQLMRKFWDAALAENPAAGGLDEGVRFPICQPEPLRRLFESAGLADVAVTEIDTPTVFEDFDDYWSPFLGGTGPAPSYCASLSEADREALRERLKASLLADPDGRIRLNARAFAVRGVSAA